MDEGKLQMTVDPNKLGNEPRIVKEFDLTISLLKKCWMILLIVK